MEQPKRETKQEVIKHSAAIQIQNSITLLQRRAWNVLLAHAYDELETEEEHHMRVQHLMQMLEFHSKNEDYLREAMEALVRCTVRWNVLSKDGEECGVTTLLAQAKVKQDICTYAYSPEMRRRLRSLVGRLAAQMPVVLLDTGLVLEDDHADYAFESGGQVLSAKPWMTPRDNLGVQTQIAAGAKAFVGTCGSLAWLAPRLGVDTSALFVDPKWLHAHLPVAMRASHKSSAPFRSAVAARSAASASSLWVSVPSTPTIAIRSIGLPSYNVVVSGPG